MKPDKAEAAILKFDREISRIIVMCKELKNEISELKKEMGEVGNSFSAKLLSNEKIDVFVNRYAEIVISYDGACKEFSKADPDLEKIMHTEGDVRELTNDVGTLIAEVKASMSFGTNFEGAVAFIFETLAPALDRIIEVGQAIKEMVRETPPSKSKKPH